MATLYYLGRCAGCRNLVAGAVRNPEHPDRAAEAVAEMVLEGCLVETQEAADEARPIFALNPCACPQKGGA